MQEPRSALAVPAARALEPLGEYAMGAHVRAMVLAGAPELRAAGARILGASLARADRLAAHVREVPELHAEVHVRVRFDSRYPMYLPSGYSVHVVRIRDP